MRTRMTLGVACAATAVLIAAAPQGVHAQSRAGSRFGASGSEAFNAQIGLGVEYAPDYEGAKKSSAGPLPILDISYRTDAFGTFALGSSYGGLAWIPVQDPIYTLALLVSYDGGRKDSNTSGGGLTKGSERLRGLGEIEGTVLYGGFASLSIGETALNLLALKAPSTKGHGGAVGSLSLEVPFDLGGIEFALSPSLNWADRKYMQAYFGVTPQQSMRSGLRPYRAGGGLKSYGIELSASMPLSARWVLSAAASVERLTGDAAKSPIVERRLQPAVSFGAAYSF